MKTAAILAFALLTALPVAASASVPNLLPVQGVLSDADGNPITGTRNLRFRIYDADAAGTTLHNEQINVVLGDNGEFTAYVGSTLALDMGVFRDQATFLGITVDTDAEMTPRFEMGSVPYAAYAQETAAVPPGAVMTFDLAACPPGWSELTAARGRALVGLPAGGTLGGTVGSALSDQENRAHAHAVDPGAVTTSSNGAHNHSVDVGSTTSSSTGNHNHSWMLWHHADKYFWTYDSGGNLQADQMMDWTQRGGELGMDTVGGGNYPLAIDDTQPPPSAGLNGYYTGNSGNHNHTVDPASVSSSTVTDHNHSCDVGSTSSTSASTGDVMPYLQLLVCRKE